MVRWFAVSLLVIAAGFAALSTQNARGEGRARWDFKAVVFTGPTSERGPDPETWVSRELKGLNDPMRPFLDDGWEPIDTTWLLGGSVLVTMKRQR